MATYPKPLLAIFYISITVLICNSQARADNSPTWTDPKTGLEWIRCAYGREIKNGVCVGEPTLLTWDEAILTIDKMEAFGHVDWRIPTQQEMRYAYTCDHKKYPRSVAYDSEIDITHTKPEFINSICNSEDDAKIQLKSQINTGAMDTEIWTSTPEDDWESSIVTQGYLFSKRVTDRPAAVLAVRAGKDNGVFTASVSLVKTRHLKKLEKKRKEEAALQEIKRKQDKMVREEKLKQAHRVAATPDFRKNVKVGDRAYYEYLNWSGIVTVLQVKGNFVQVRGQIGDRWASINDIFAE